MLRFFRQEKSTEETFFFSLHELMGLLSLSVSKVQLKATCGPETYALLLSCLEDSLALEEAKSKVRVVEQEAKSSTMGEMTLKGCLGDSFG